MRSDGAREAILACRLAISWSASETITLLMLDGAVDLGFAGEEVLVGCKVLEWLVRLPGASDLGIEVVFFKDCGCPEVLLLADSGD